MTNAPWDEMTSRWRDLYNDQAKLTQKWVESQAELASTMTATATASSDEERSSTGFDPKALAELWRSGMALDTAGLPGFEAGSLGSEAVRKMLDPMSLSLMGGNQVGEIIRRLTEGPRLADAGSVERGMAELMELYLGVQAASRAYESVLANAWMEANKRFLAEVARRGTDAKTLSPKEQMTVWLAAADETMTQTHRSEAFLEAQRELLRAGMDFLMAERKLVEQFVAPAGLPTRSELDELHRTVHLLKRRVRTLESATPEETVARPRKPGARSKTAGPKRSAQGAEQ